MLSTGQKIQFVINPFFTIKEGAKLTTEKYKEKWAQKSDGEKVLSVLTAPFTLIADGVQIAKDDMEEKTPGQRLLSVLCLQGAVATSLNNRQQFIA